MTEPSNSNPDDPELELLAEYMEESRLLEAGSPELRSLRARFLEDHPQIRTMLQSHFDDEDRLFTELGSGDSDIPRLDRYAEISLLGRGGMGVVYKAFDQDLKRWVAIKFCPPGAVSNDYKNRFRVEAESVAALKHPNIVKVFDVRDYEDRPYLTMELIEGGSLDQHLDRYRRDQRELAHLMIDVARAVHHAHQRQILHRDLKPANILLHTEADGSVTPHVVDFGLAKLLEDSGSGVRDNVPPGDASIAYGRLVGTVSYMSPEQAQRRAATTQSDIYGLGTVLYALLTGHPPYRGNSVDETLGQIVDTDTRPKAPRRIDPEVDPTLEAICLKCLAFDPADRYESAEGLALDLERWLAHQPTRARRLRPAALLALWSRRNPLGLGLVILLGALLALSALTIWILNSQTQALLENNAFLTADRVRVWAEKEGNRLSLWAADHRLGEFIAQNDLERLQESILTWKEETRDPSDCSEVYESVFVVLAAETRNGAQAARCPYPNKDDAGFDYRVRDYFKGAERNANRPIGSDAYWSKVFYSVGDDDEYKFAISVPLRHEGQLVGVFAASMTTSSNLELLPDSVDGDSAFVLLAEKDPSRAPKEPDTQAELAGDLAVFVHPGQDPGDLAWVERRYEEVFRSGGCLKRYRDPVAESGAGRANDYSGAWTACSSAVAGTEFIAVFQKRSAGLP